MLFLRLSPIIVGGRARGEVDQQDGGSREDGTTDRHQGDSPLFGDNSHRSQTEAEGDGAPVQTAGAATREVRIHRASRVAAEGNEDGSPGTLSVMCLIIVNN